MRKYRGLTKEGKWVYGCLIEFEDMSIIFEDSVIITKCSFKPYSFIASDFWVEVIPETVGQSTGLKDKNGKEIYRGDIVRLMTYKSYLSREKNKYRLEVVTKGCACGLNTNGLVSIQKEGQEEYERQFEVIGNRHQNPELLEQKNG